jgi:hypothetical protein
MNLRAERTFSTMKWRIWRNKAAFVAGNTSAGRDVSLNGTGKRYNAGSTVLLCAVISGVLVLSSIILQKYQKSPDKKNEKSPTSHLPPFPFLGHPVGYHGMPYISVGSEMMLFPISGGMMFDLMSLVRMS